MTEPTFADDCEAVVQLLADGPPLTIDGIRDKLGWSQRTVNQVLCALRLSGAVACEQARVKGKKVNTYTLKRAT